MKENNILIVEDEQIIAENLRFILQEYGYDQVDVAIDALEAQELFKETNYRLVLMDINLGDHSTVDGIDLIKTLSPFCEYISICQCRNCVKRCFKK